ncbi:MAG: YicC/YloC family endoribonuclease [Oscillospiraceae bacterium]
MLKSMTGYGREQVLFGSREIVAEVKSVNHRYYEFTARLPRAYGWLEEKLKSFFAGSISRGKVEVYVSVADKAAADTQIALNKEIALGYVDALRTANEALGLADDLSLSHILRLPDVFTVVKVQEDEEQLWAQVALTAQAALAHFMEMRIREGDKLAEDIGGRLDFIEQTVKKIEAQSPTVTESYRTRLYNKLKDLLGDTGVDEQRILTEAAIFSEKTAVDEETVRLRSHLGQFRELIVTDIPVGKKLDFLVQEMNREVNTIGSKAQDITITRMVVDLKSEIEKIREQIQNVE